MTIFIHGEPKGQPRPRAFARKMGAKYVARVYDSDVADDWKAAVDKELKSATLDEEMTKHLCPDSGAGYTVGMTFSLPRPKSHFRANGKLKPNAPCFHRAKPDADNLAKLVLDRITKSARIWADDSQVYELAIIKRYENNPELCGVTLAISRIHESGVGS